MSRNLLETVMGAVVLVVASGFLLFAYERSAVQTVEGYQVSAQFSDVSGISNGSDVRIGGLKVGVVDRMELDQTSYQANLWLQIREDIKLPKDSSAAVISSGLLGDKFIKLEPGGAEEMLADGGSIRFTQSSVSFEELIGKFVFSGGGVDDASSHNDEQGEDGEANNPFSLGL